MILKQESNNDLINRQQALNIVAKTKVRWQAIKNIRNLPSIKQESTGYWIMPVQDDGMSDPIYYQIRCSKCGFDLDPQTWDMELRQYSADKYCPSCGARMIES
mgnify:CR=1 FL=1